MGIGLQRHAERRGMFARRGLELALGTGLALTLAMPAAAQNTAPPTRDELSTPTRQDAPREDDVTLSVDGGLDRSACALADPQYADLRITLRAIRFTGAERAADVDLARAYDGYLGRELPVGALCEIRDRAAALLEAAGYLAAVEIPAQSLGDNEAELGVVLGRLVAIRARGDVAGSQAVLAGYLQRLADGEVFNVQRAERYLLLANDIPGTDVRLSLRPAAGGAPGDLVAEVAVLGERAGLDIAVQNYGSRALGRYGGLMRAEYYGLTGHGDRTSLALYSTLDFVEQQTIQLSHEMRLGADGLTLGGQITAGWTEPDAIPGFTIESDTIFATLEATYPLVRRQRQSLWAGIGMDLADQDVRVNRAGLTHDRVRTAFARLRFSSLDEASILRRGGYSPYEPRLRLAGEVELRQGVSILGATRDCRGAVLACTTGGAVPPARIEQDPTPTLARGSLSVEARATPRFGFAVDVRGQYADEALPSFEEFAGGNYAIGRGFDPASVLGDSGVGGSLEMRYGTLVPDGPGELAVQTYAFTDVARTWDNDPSLVAGNPDQLWSAGAGLRFVRGNTMQGDLTVAVPLERTDGQSRIGPLRLLFSLSTRFGMRSR